MARKHVLTVGLAAAMLLSAAPADARTGYNSSTATSALKTISVNVMARDESQCSQYSAGVQHWQCTPVLIATVTPQQSVSTGGTVSWSVYATCEYRERADGLNNDWTAWTSCGPYSRSANDSRSWGALQAPSGGFTQFNWGTVDNAETAFTTDCVEIRTSIRVTGTANDTAEQVSATTRFPSVGTNLSGICEGGSAY